MVFRVVGQATLLAAVLAVTPAAIAQPNRMGLTEYAVAGRWKDFDGIQRWSFASWAARRIDRIYKLGMTPAERVELTVDLHNCMHDLLDNGGLAVMEHTHLSDIVRLCWKLTHQRRTVRANS